MDRMDGGGSCRKRKKYDRPPVDQEGDADDESKMKDFFDLIHNLGQSLKSHGWLVAAIADDNKNKRMKGGWEPRFELQDFADDHGVAAVAAVALNDDTAPPPSSDLDLSLSLSL